MSPVATDLVLSSSCNKSFITSYDGEKIVNIRVELVLRIQNSLGLEIFVQYYQIVLVICVYYFPIDRRNHRRPTFCKLFGLSYFSVDEQGNGVIKVSSDKCIVRARKNLKSEG